MSNVGSVSSSQSEVFYPYDHFQTSEVIQASLGRKSEDAYCFESRTCNTVEMPLTTYVTAKTGQGGSKSTEFRIDPTEMHKISIDKFKKVILENQRPEHSPVFRGFELVSRSRWLGWDGDRHIIYQETGEGSVLMFTINPRVYMVGVYVAEETDRKISIKWDLVNNYDPIAGQFTGKWASQLSSLGITPPANHVWTPYSSGEWTLDLDQRLITYKVTSDPGGSVPNINFDGPALKFTNFIINELLGLSGSAVMSN